MSFSRPTGKRLCADTTVMRRAKQDHVAGRSDLQRVAPFGRRERRARRRIGECLSHGFKLLLPLGPTVRHGLFAAKLGVPGYLLRYRASKTPQEPRARRV